MSGHMRNIIAVNDGEVRTWIYHVTPIVEEEDGWIYVSHGGYFTASTFKRINQILKLLDVDVTVRRIDGNMIAMLDGHSFSLCDEYSLGWHKLCRCNKKREEFSEFLNLKKD